MSNTELVEIIKRERDWLKALKLNDTVHVWRHGHWNSGFVEDCTKRYVRVLGRRYRRSDGVELGDRINKGSYIASYPEVQG